MHLYPFAIILLEISKLCVIICLRKVCWIELSKKKKKKHVHLFVCFAFVMAAYKLPIKTTFRLEAQQSESQVLSFRALRLVAHQHSAAHSCVEAPLRCSVCVCVFSFDITSARYRRASKLSQDLFLLLLLLLSA